MKSTQTNNIAENITNNQSINEESRTSYVVIRDRFRVSDREYLSSNDQCAIDEKELWSRIAKKYSYGESVNIVQYDSKKHRVW